MKKEVEIYTDGACIGNGRPINIGGYSFVVVKNNNLIHQFVSIERNTTNNRQEIKGVLDALQYCHENKISSFTIKSDSQYVVNGFTEWMENWKIKGWVRGFPPQLIPNYDLWKELYRMKMLFKEVDIRWVRGHNGNKWNEYADRLIEDAIAAE